MPALIIMRTNTFNPLIIIGVRYTKICFSMICCLFEATKQK